MSKEQKNKKRPFRPNGAMGWIAGIFLLLIEVVFTGLLMLANLLPVSYLVAVIAFIIAVDFGIFALLHKKGNVKLTGLILSVLLLCVFSLGGFYLMLTNNAFASITGGWEQSERYHVIALKESKFNEVEDIKGETIYVTKDKSLMNQEAQQKLLTKVDVSYEPADDMMDCGHKLIAENGSKYDRLIFVSNSQYSMIGEEIDGFKDETKILYTVRVPIKSAEESAKINVTKDSYNIYITGIDNYGEIEQVGRSDVNMIEHKVIKIQLINRKKMTFAG